jgi:hypothetical protein
LIYFYGGKVVTQLVKLTDCISRYELNIFHYAGQFSTLKQRRWLEWEEHNGDFMQYSKNELRRKFLKELQKFQIRWVCSTLEDESYLPKKVVDSEKFQYFMTQFPDNYLVMYHPIFKIDKAFIEAEILLFSPNKLYCISYIENSKESIITSQKSNFWIHTVENRQRNILSPYVSINRMAEVANSLLVGANDYPVEYLVIAPNGYIEVANPTNRVTIIDKRNEKSWLEKMVNLRDPVKFKQLKATETMLENCETKSFKRQELG